MTKTNVKATRSKEHYATIKLQGEWGNVAMALTRALRGRGFGSASWMPSSGPKPYLPVFTPLGPLTEEVGFRIIVQEIPVSYGHWHTPDGMKVNYRIAVKGIDQTRLFSRNTLDGSFDYAGIADTAWDMYKDWIHEVRQDTEYIRKSGMNEKIYTELLSKHKNKKPLLVGMSEIDELVSVQPSETLRYRLAVVAQLQGNFTLEETEQIIEFVRKMRKASASESRLPD